MSGSLGHEGHLCAVQETGRGASSMATSPSESLNDMASAPTDIDRVQDLMDTPFDDSQGHGKRWARHLAYYLAINTPIEHELDLYRRRVGTKGGEAIGHALETNTTLQDLNLSGNCLQDRGAKGIACGLRLNTSLTNLDMGHSALREEAGLFLGYALEDNSTLEHLSLEGNPLMSEGATGIAMGLRHNTSLKVLDLSECEIQGDGLHEIFSAAVHLDSLDLTRQCKGIPGWLLFPDLRISGMPHLRELDMSYNRIQNAGAARIADALSRMPLLINLNLKRCGIRGAGAEAIGWALGQHSLLRVLSLNCNLIEARGGTGIGHGLAQNMSLEELNLSFNRMGAEGGSAVCAGVLVNSSLVRLVLCHEIGDEGLVLIASALTRSKCLAVLEIWVYDEEKDFSMTAVLAMGLAIRDSPRLESIVLQGIRLGKAWEGLGLPPACNICEREDPLGSDIAHRNRSSGRFKEWNNKGIINMWAACRQEHDRLWCDKIVAFGLGPRLDGRGAPGPVQILGSDMFRLVAQLVVRELSQVDDWAIVWPSAWSSIAYEDWL